MGTNAIHMAYIQEQADIRAHVVGRRKQQIRSFGAQRAGDVGQGPHAAGQALQATVKNVYGWETMLKKMFRSHVFFCLSDSLSVCKSVSQSVCVCLTVCLSGCVCLSHKHKVNRGTPTCSSKYSPPLPPVLCRRSSMTSVMRRMSSMMVRRSSCDSLQ